MSKVLDAILVGVYTAVIIQFIRSILMDKKEIVFELNYLTRSPGTLKKMNRQIKNHGIKQREMTVDYKKPKRFPTDLKFILKYSQGFSHFSSSAFVNGQQTFTDSNCTYVNCYFTNDKSLLNDVRNFDAIVFDVENNWDHHPVHRSPHQRYIFTGSESGDNFPVCHSYFDNYYNWTWTFKLDSDIRWSYIIIVDKNDKVVGPKINMNWISPMKPTPAFVRKKLEKKTKMAAWFVSNCWAKSDRHVTAMKINEHLLLEGYELDIFGNCGSKICPGERMEECLNVMEETYHFYFAFENSFSDDYVTEKLLHAVRHYTVPVVFGGADYTRFLPPGSYLDASGSPARTVARKMIEAVKDKEKYADYFRWHNYYKYQKPKEVSDVCTLCRLLNEEHEPKTIRDFRKWWNPKYKESCSSPLDQLDIPKYDDSEDPELKEAKMYERMKYLNATTKKLSEIIGI